MLFNSINFLLFFPIVVLAYFIIPEKFRYLWLLAASYFFYMSWYPKWAVLLLFSTLITYASGLFMEWIRRCAWDDHKRVRWKKGSVLVSFVLNLAVLFLFKYTNFTIDNLNVLLEVLHLEAVDYSVGLALPVGISFYTFQALGYTMDVYREDIYAEKNFLKYALFVSFFPQLVAGPIERSKNLLKQINAEHPFCGAAVKDGLLLMLWGYFLKLVLADRIAIFVDTVYGDYVSYSGWYLILASVLFAFQIYCDFAGYSTIAMGAARVMGFQLMENFDCPYWSRSVTEFWRRWHISLSGWFRDYLYIPLGGNRKGTLRKYINVMVVFLASGLWHGADWTFVIWGGLNGAYQAAEAVTGKFRKKLNRTLHLDPALLCHKVMRTVLTFILVDIAWIFFRADSVGTALAILSSMFQADNFWIFLDGSIYQAGLDARNFWLMIFAVTVLMTADYFKYKGITIRKEIQRQELWARWMIYIGAVLLILLAGIWGPSYSAKSFIYFQF